MHAFPCKGGPLDGGSAAPAIASLTYWVVQDETGPRLIPNTAELPYAEIVSAYGVYTKEFVKATSGKTTNILLYRKLR